MTSVSTTSSAEALTTVPSVQLRESGPKTWTKRPAGRLASRSGPRTSVVVGGCSGAGVAGFWTTGRDEAQPASQRAALAASSIGRTISLPSTSAIAPLQMSPLGAGPRDPPKAAAVYHNRPPATRHFRMTDEEIRVESG